MKRNALLSLAFTIALPSLAPLAVAAESLPPGGSSWGKSQGNDIPLLDKEQEREVDAAQNKATAELLWAAQWIDSFFELRYLAI